MAKFTLSRTTVKISTPTDIGAVSKSAPNLQILVLRLPPVSFWQENPLLLKLLWTFDWDSLPWKTRCYVEYYNHITREITRDNLDLRGKITSYKIPSDYIECLSSFTVLDLSYNELMPLRNIQTSCLNISLSYNSFHNVSSFSHEQMAKMEVFDLSYDKLQGNITDNLPFNADSHIQVLNLSHNQIRRIPVYLTPYLNYIDLSVNGNTE